MSKQKPVISADHAINWYIDNYVMNPNNALMDDEELLDRIFNATEALRSELKGGG